MRFQFFSIITVCLASLAVAQPLPLEVRAKDGVLQEVGELIGELEKIIGLPVLDAALNRAFDGELSDLEESLGITKLEQSLNIISGMSDDGALQAVGKFLRVLEEKYGIITIEDWINKVSGGGPEKLEDFLGLTKLEEGLGLEK